MIEDYDRLAEIEERAATGDHIRAVDALWLLRQIDGLLADIKQHNFNIVHHGDQEGVLKNFDDIEKLFSEMFGMPVKLQINFMHPDGMKSAWLLEKDADAYYSWLKMRVSIKADDLAKKVGLKP
jgi:hypothetical protein